ncbi:MAG: GtrA family protein [Dehalococcoidia bacterium]
MTSRVAVVGNFILSSPRLVKFAAVGVVASGCQLLGLYIIKSAGLPAAWANLLAFIISTQINFVLSYQFTWLDRKAERPTPGYILRRLVGFNWMRLTTLAINQGTFVVAHLFFHYLLAGAIAIAVAAGVSFTLSDLFIFRAARTRPGAGASDVHGR